MTDPAENETPATPEVKPATAAPEKDLTFFHERLLPLGWTPENGRFTTPKWEVRGGQWHVLQPEEPGYEEYTHELFTVNDKGDIVIPYFTIRGYPVRYGESQKKYEQIRLRMCTVDKDGHALKYKNPSKAGTPPWFPPRLIEAFRTQRQIDTLVLTEGAFKAYTAALRGLDVVGLLSITTAKDKTVDTLHPDILELIKRCQPKQIVWLVDGDCRQLSTKWPENPEVDLYTRPNTFFRSAYNLRELLKDLGRLVGFEVYFMHVDSNSLQLPKTETKPKGLDDLLITYAKLQADHAEAMASQKVAGWSELTPEQQAEAVKKERAAAEQQAYDQVIADACQFSAPNKFFVRKGLERIKDVRDYFAVDSAIQFYKAYEDLIGDREFVFNGTRYKWDPEKNNKSGELDIKQPAVARAFVRVRDQYLEDVMVPNRFGVREKQLLPISKQTIIDDYTKNIISKIRKLKAYCNVPDHIGYQPIIHNCLNLYQPLDHVPEEGDWSNTKMFLEHIFGTRVITCEHPKEFNEDGTAKTIVRKSDGQPLTELDLGLDYLQLLFTKPTQPLPILCLGSSKRGTGKTTFGDWLADMFGANAATLGNDDVVSDFNAHYITKSVVMIEESKIEKTTVIEKIKNLSTASWAIRNAKGENQVRVETFLHFVMMTNNVRDFVRTDDEETRFWVRDVPVIDPTKLNTELKQALHDEIPAFLHMLQNRPMATEKLYRAWFHPPLLETEALKLVRLHSQPQVIKDLTDYLVRMFTATEQEELLLTAENIRMEVFRGKYDNNYIRDCVAKLKVPPKRYTNEKGEEVTTRYSIWRLQESKHELEGLKTEVVPVRQTPGRPWKFQRKDYITDAAWLAREVDPTNGGMATNGNGTPAHDGRKAAANDGQDDLPF